MRRPRPLARPLAEFLDVCLSPSLAAQGFATSDIIMAWADIVGERLAAFTQPLKIEWKRKAPHADPEARPEPATLVIRVESAFALELQHMAPTVIDRVNTYYGWRCIGKIVLKQGPVRRVEKRKPPVPSLSPADKAKVSAAIGGIEEDSLKAALDRLGQAIVSSGSRTKE
ncbi:DUF721 domain-containing protein [Microvirga guangxiensis]|uniref:DUF721 domain-containing protein n=1 Tax=Microvirga guangxiensis TaxID=549386 RepID=A0A1G5JMP7_9HYPH|nr:DciA family protein [Microvirga guangxiensis]SCY89434.1 hypothetical protein SAMN02927923_02743 [Microvirga guangxiensis]